MSLLEFNNICFLTNGIDWVTKFGLLLEEKHVLNLMNKFWGVFLQRFFFSSGYFESNCTILK